MPKHTVILGSYNRPKMIHQAIKSVLDQTVGDFQLIIADDGSNDETMAAIHQLIDKDTRCLLMTVDRLDDTKERKDCANRAVQRINDAIPRITGDIVHYLADDDWYDTKRFEIFDELFLNRNVVVGYGRLMYANVDGTLKGTTRYFSNVPNPLCVLDHNQVCHRRMTYEKIQKWADAVDYTSEGHFFKALSHNWRFYGIDKVVAYKREHPLCMTTTRHGSTGKRE